MQIIPAVDIRDGRCVRLLQGDFDQETVFGQDPVEMALHWESLGAERLHVVDLDGARTGIPQNLDIIAEIARSLKIPVQMGGGIRSIKIAGRVLDLGVNRVIIGTSAALDSKLTQNLFDAFGEKIILGLDARDGWVSIHGWRETIDRRAVDFAKEMEKIGARRIIHTDIGRDGLMAGVNIDAMKTMANAVDIPVIASGGVTSIDDIHNLKAIESFGIEGVIAGKALYTEALNLPEAIEAARGSDNLED